MARQGRKRDRQSREKPPGLALPQPGVATQHLARWCRIGWGNCRQPAVVPVLAATITREPVADIAAGPRVGPVSNGSDMAKIRPSFPTGWEFDQLGMAVFHTTLLVAFQRTGGFASG
jgi:hypothetical protein